MCSSDLNPERALAHLGGNDSGKDDQSEIPVGLEFGKAVSGIGDIDGLCLPRQVQGTEREAEIKGPGKSSQESGHRHQNNGDAVKPAKPRSGCGGVFQRR